MTRKHRSHRISVLMRQGLQSSSQDRPFLKGKGVARAEVWEMLACVREVQLSFNSRSPVEIGRLRAAIIAQPLAEVFNQRASGLRGVGDVGQRLWQGHGEVKGKLTE